MTHTNDNCEPSLDEIQAEYEAAADAGAPWVVLDRILARYDSAQARVSA